jgi:hypothetical protein
MESLPTLPHRMIFSPTAASKPACVKLQKIEVSIMHQSPLPNPPPAKLKAINSEL